MADTARRMVENLRPDVELEGMMDELRECPMCGNKAHYQEWKIGQTIMGWRVICGGCSVMTANWHSKEAAKKSWNARAYDAEIAAMKERDEVAANI